MKTLKLFRLFLFFVIIITVSCNRSDESKGYKVLDLKVLGNCEMCKKTIESSISGESGIEKADWNVGTKMLKVTYDPKKITEDKILAEISDAGYDSEKKKGSDSAYNNLHACCKYVRK